jgi:hypothetical protein
MKKIFDSYTFDPQEDIKYYLDPDKNEKRTWSEPPTKEELTELFEQWPEGTKLEDVFPHCKVCFKYPRIADNIYLYRKLTESKNFRGLFDPLDFFNLLYEQLQFVLSNVFTDPQEVIDHLERLNLVKRKLHFLLYSMHYLIKGLNGSVTADRIWPDGIYTIKNNKLGGIHLEIIAAYQSLEKELEIETESTDLSNDRSGSGSPLIPGGSLQRLKIKQIALIHIYEKKSISRENSSGIAEKYGYFSKNSGEKLYQEYIFYSSNANRKAVPETKLMLRNKIELFESILEHLEDKAKAWATDEINLLKVRNGESNS